MTACANNGGNVPPSGYGTAGAGGAFAGGGVTTPTSVQGELFMQLQQMQDELARLRGTLEEQQNQIQQLKQESLERYQDLDRRISGGGAPAAQNSAPAGAINANGAPALPQVTTHRRRAASRATRRRRSSTTMRPST